MRRAAVLSGIPDLDHELAVRPGLEARLQSARIDQVPGNGTDREWPGRSRELEHRQNDAEGCAQSRQAIPTKLGQSLS